MKALMLFFLLISIPLFMGVSSCGETPVKIDPSEFALKSGHATMLVGGEPLGTMAVGGCYRDLTIGYDSCWFEKGATLPPLIMIFTNPAQYAVSDCKLAIYKTGSVEKPGTVEVDLNPLSKQLNDSGFCILRVEVVEYYPDPNDENQIRQFPMAGGWFIEMFDKGYFPVPANDVAGWCYVVRRTTSGRVKMDACK